MLFPKPGPSVRCVSWTIALAVGLFAHSANAQAVASAFGPSHALWVGGEYSNIHAGFPYQSSQRLSGLGAFADYHLTVHTGIEAEARFLRFNSYYGETEDNYLGGPRYLIRASGKIQPYAQCLAGFAAMQFPFDIGSRKYLAIAPGAGINYRLSRKWTLRGEYEFQFWPGSPNYANEPEHRITPNGIHIGLAYRAIR